MTIVRKSSGESPRRPVSTATRAATLLAVLCAGNVVGSTGPAAPGRQATLSERYADAMRAGDHAAAAAAARQALDLAPGDALLAHNLACAEARHGDLAAAWDALAQSLGSELADPHLAESDSDLTILRADPRFLSLLQEARRRLRDDADVRAMVLREGYQSQELELTAGAARRHDRGSRGWPRVKVQIMHSGGGLGFKATVEATSFQDRPQPWRLGDGFQVTVAVPPPGGGFDSERSFSFGFGVTGGSPIGALIERDGDPETQAVVDLAPKVRIHGGRAEYSFRIPWEAIAPYAPPVDSLLGLNVSYVSVDEDGTRRIIGLVPEPALQTGRGPWRRFVPLGLAPSDRSEAVLRGAVNNTIVGDGPVGIRLAAWLPEGGRASLRLEVTDAAGRTVGRSTENAADGVASLVVTKGVNRWVRTADLSALPSGPFRLAVELLPPTGGPLRWQSGLLRLDAGWLDQARQRANRVGPEDRPSLDYRIERIAEALARHDPRADPGPLGTTLVEAGLILQRCERGGSALPDSGTFVAAFRAADGGYGTCGLVLPRGHRSLRKPRLLVLLGSGGAAGGRRAAQIAEHAGLPPDVIVAIPDWRTPSEAPASNPAARAAEAARWASQRFAAREALLVGLGEGAGDALHSSLEQPAAWSRVLILADAGWMPWPQGEARQLADRLRDHRNELPYTIVVAVPPMGETGEPDGAGAPAPGEEVTTAMESAGFRVNGRRHAGGVISGAAAGEWITAWLAEKDALRPRRN